MGKMCRTTRECPRVTGFIPETVNQLNIIVTERAESVGAENIGVVIGVFEEGVQILQEAAAYPALASTRWYGTDGMAESSSLLSNSTARNFARQTQFVCTQPDKYTNAMYVAISDAIKAKTGIEPTPYALHAYDALWLTALALRDTDGTGTVAQMRAAIRTEATNYTGASGPIYFNANGDRSNGLYQLVRVTNSNEWENAFQCVPEAPVVRSPTNQTLNSFVGRWRSSAGALQYYLDVSSSPGFEPASYVGPYSNLLVGVGCSYVVTGLTSGESYYYRVRAGNTAGASSNSAGMSAPLPAYAVITATANSGGRVTPSGPVIAYPGWSVMFTAMACSPGRNTLQGPGRTIPPVCCVSRNPTGRSGKILFSGGRDPSTGCTPFSIRQIS